MMLEKADFTFIDPPDSREAEFSRLANMGRSPILFNPHQTSPELLHDNYYQIIKGSYEMAEKSGICETPQGLTSLAYSLANSFIMRRVLSDLSKVQNSSLMEQLDATEVYNPSRKLDLIGGNLARDLVAFSPFQTPTKLFVEEQKSFLHYHPDHDQAEQIIIVDPLDGTTNARNGIKAQSSGMVITDKEGRLLAGSVACLVRGGELAEDEILLVDNGRGKLVKFDEVNLSLREIPLGFHGGESAIENSKVALFGNRIPIFKQAYPHYQTEPFPEFGGYTLLGLLNGTLDAMMDLKGEKWAEIGIWGYLAQALEKQSGLFVAINGNDHFDFPGLITQAVANQSPEVAPENWAPKVIAVISNSPQIQNKLKEKFPGKKTE